MKLSINWLRQYINHELTAEELSVRLTMAGFEVEQAESFGEDTVFDIEVTPNRPDCLCVLGLAREVSAIVDKDFNIPTTGSYPDVGEVKIEIESSADCMRYIGTVIKGVVVGNWTDNRVMFLKSFGLKSALNIVDIANFVLFETGQPLHAFDLDKLHGRRVIVRRARRGEKIVTLDNVERILDESILVIADEKKPVAIAGIMGGRDTAVKRETKNILLEAAVFDPALIRRASRKLALTSDSCYRFERAVFLETALFGANRAADLILNSVGGKVSARKDLGVVKSMASCKNIEVTQKDISRLLGTEIDMLRAKRILERLGCSVSLNQSSFIVMPPYFRQDIQIKEDVIEEVSRIIGYDNLSMTMPLISSNNISVNVESGRFCEQISRTIAGLGFNEVVTYSLMSGTALKAINYNGAAVRLQNPLSSEQEVLRPTALANMLKVAAINMNHGQKDLKLFEVGKSYFSQGERWFCSFLLSGQMLEDWRISEKHMCDFFDLKGVLEAVFERQGVKEMVFLSSEDLAFESGQSASVGLKGNIVGRIGRVSKEVLAGFDIKKSNVYFAEVDLEQLWDEGIQSRKFFELKDFPIMTRDVSFAVKDVNFKDIKDVCFQYGAGLVQRISFMELYIGDKIEAGFRGYVFSLTYQSSERTLTDDEVNVLHEEIIEKLVRTFNIKRR